MSKKNKKSQKEKQQYREHVFTSTVSEDQTEFRRFVNLEGSNEIVDYSNLNKQIKEEKPIATPIHIKIKDFIKSHVIEIIICPLLIYYITWSVENIYNLKADTKLINYRVEQIEVTLDEIDNDNMTKEMFEAQIDLLKSELDGASREDITDIYQRLDVIETELDFYINHK